MEQCFYFFSKVSGKTRVFARCEMRLLLLQLPLIKGLLSPDLLLLGGERPPFLLEVLIDSLLIIAQDLFHLREEYLAIE